jgi:hypothetical protein
MLDGMPAVLHIEHPITDLDTWLTAFGRFAEARERAGVRGHRIHQPVDDAHFIVVDLWFDDVEGAERFRGFLEANVWSNAEASPGLAGTPMARILTPVG